mmetsp:Transcript_15494/g.45879  ORF Transcript_15494/g.45879 Transcript_15494/m.45879 type:complete len:213 (+) Transcript_15494:102-740(+)
MRHKLSRGAATGRQHASAEGDDGTTAEHSNGCVLCERGVSGRHGPRSHAPRTALPVSRRTALRHTRHTRASERAPRTTSTSSHTPRKKINSAETVHSRWRTLTSVSAAWHCGASRPPRVAPLRRRRRRGPPDRGRACPVARAARRGPRNGGRAPTAARSPLAALARRVRARRGYAGGRAPPALRAPHSPPPPPARPAASARARVRPPARGCP